MLEGEHQCTCAGNLSLGPGWPSGVTSEYPSLALNRTSLPPDPSLHGETFWTLPPERAEQPFFFAAFSAGGGVSSIHGGCSATARRSYPRPQRPPS